MDALKGTICQSLKVVAIADATSDTGEATARLLAQRSAHALLGARTIGRLTALADETARADGSVHYRALDAMRHDTARRASTQCFLEVWPGRRNPQQRQRSAGVGSGRHDGDVLDLMPQVRVPESRRCHGVTLKAQVLAECARPHAFVASIAMAHGLNANLVHKWCRLAGKSQAPTPNPVIEFGALPLAAHAQMAEGDIAIELRRGAITLKGSGPTSTVAVGPASQTSTRWRSSSNATRHLRPLQSRVAVC
jgi:transposase